MSKPAVAALITPLLAVAIVVGGSLAALGVLPFAALVAITLVAWIRRTARALGPDLALGTGVLLALAACLVIPIAANVLPLGLAWAPSLIVAGLGLFALAGAPPLQRPRRHALAWAASALGGVVWLVGTAIASAIPTSSVVGWPMGGDTANNVLFARQALSAGAIRLGSAENPVPLPAALLADALAPGRAGIDTADLLRHDIVGLGVTWSAVIALVCLLGGRVLATFAGSGRSAPVAAAIGSLLPLTWFVSGYPIEFGFFNAHLTLALLLSALLVFLAGRRAPAPTLAFLALASTLVLATWSPLVLVPGLLAAIILVRDRRQLVAARGPWFAVLLLALVSLIAWGVLVTLPVLVAHGEALAAPGGVLAFSRWFVLALLVGGAVAGLLLLHDARGRGLAMLAFVVAVGAGWAMLLFQARATESPFASYYPAKLAWLGAVMLMAIGVGIVWRRVVGIRSRAFRRSLLGAVAAGTALLAVVAPALQTAYPQNTPLVRILVGGFSPGGDVSTERVLAFVDAAHPRVVWRSGDPDERTLNFWSLMMAGGIEVEYLPLRIAAYGEYTDSVDDLCRVVGLVPEEVTVLTADPDLEGSYRDVCPHPATFEWLG